MRKFLGVDGKEFKIDLKPSSYPMRNEKACKSKIQFACGQVLKEFFPYSPILEEVPIPKHGLTLDFFLPQENLVVEVNGIQHEKYVPYFHGSPQGFMQSKERDRIKAEWCEVNNIKLISVKTIEELRELL